MGRHRRFRQEPELNSLSDKELIKQHALLWVQRNKLGTASMYDYNQKSREIKRFEREILRRLDFARHIVEAMTI